MSCLLARQILLVPARDMHGAHACSRLWQQFQFQTQRTGISVAYFCDHLVQ